MNALSWICIIVMATCAFFIGYGVCDVTWINRMIHLCEGLTETIKATQEGLKIVEKELTEIGEKLPDSGVRD